jgi:PII-like signaling protein
MRPSAPLRENVVRAARTDLDRVHELRHAGKTILEIAAELGVSAATLYRGLAASGAGAKTSPDAESATARK